MSEKIQMKDFVAQAIVTESNDFKNISERLSVPKNIRLLHSSIGISTELTELVEALAKSELDSVNIKEETADAFWYVAIACDTLNIKFEQLLSEAYELSIHNHEHFVSIKNFASRLVSLRKILQRRQLQSLLNESIKGSGNCLDVMKKTIFYQNREFNQEKFYQNLVKTTSALLQILSKVAEVSLEDALTTLIEKLQKVRYKTGKFTAEESMNRDLSTERQVLEKK